MRLESSSGDHRVRPHLYLRLQTILSGLYDRHLHKGVLNSQAKRGRLVVPEVDIDHHLQDYQLGIGQDDGVGFFSRHCAPYFCARSHSGERPRAHVTME